MQFLIDTKFISTRTMENRYNKFRQRARTQLLTEDEYKCPDCGCLMTRAEATIDHIIPNIIIKVSRGKLEHDINKLRITCNVCNNHNKIHQNIGTLFCSTYGPEVRNAATYICDLVRKKDSELP